MNFFPCLTTIVIHYITEKQRTIVGPRKKIRERESERATDFFARIRHPRPRLGFWDPPMRNPRATTDLPDIPASEHRRQNLDTSLYSFGVVGVPRIPRFPRALNGHGAVRSYGKAGEMNRLHRLLLSFAGWNKKMGGALDVPGPDLSLRDGRDGTVRDESRLGLRSVDPFPSTVRPDRSVPPLVSSPSVLSFSREAAGRMEGSRTRGEWMKTANHRQPARRLATGISRDPARIRTKAAVAAVSLLLLLALLSTSSSTVVE